MNFTRAREVMKQHFHPLGFDATMQTPHTLLARVFDPATDETLLTVTGIPCAKQLSEEDVERIIRAVESDLELVTRNGVFNRT
ncbi:hypothetical protein DN824_13805 [Stutzerimonas nosocomialis]|uniref:DUF1652 domain-containing protein n=2 Tax=Stutzerimonas nosocomialis TaxID=1056496 RepID=A0A5R9QBH0_9GAMM|nr:hypothetical protein DN826_16155 [Stutzerimonas nosocomialis]TLX56778.1 hypothetical protein DN824_13805 [Stutzerimonas nosocomialis]TLX62083.1 hypothetical protein DN820_17890 [Stutzerimonas nosocomialis]